MCPHEYTEGGYFRHTAMSQASIGRDVRRLAVLLQLAEKAHHAYEQEHGLDTDWPTWYAKYLLGVE